jgi:hypothetical protein
MLKNNFFNPLGNSLTYNFTRFTILIEFILKIILQISININKRLASICTQFKLEIVFLSLI